MPSLGGSATANGILYQVLGTLGHAVEITLRVTTTGEDISAATLVIEPLGGGGDVQILAQEQRVVEQWKARSGGGTWSLTELINDVLPDLYCAVNDDVTVYRFVTEGRIGTWKGAYSFFQGLGTPPARANVLESLDDTQQQEFSAGQMLTERQLFLRVVDVMRCRPSVSEEPLEQTHRKVWQLLSRFEIRQQLEPEELIIKINEKLRAVVDHIEDVDAKRYELCGRVLHLASQGNVRIRAEDVLQNAGLTLKSFLAWDALRDKLRNRLYKQFCIEQYIPEYDVRPVVSLASGLSITIFTGDSGQGKTWALAKLAYTVVEGSALVVWVTGSRGNNSAGQMAADEIWCHGLQHDQPLTLERVAERRAAVNSECPMPWAVVCIDGVHSREEAAYLAGMDWEGWGLHLALSAPSEVTEYLRNQYPRRIQVIEVSDFTQPQLREYLARQGRSWANTPPDIRDLIRRPVLAKLYVELAGNERPDWAPRQEYELMEAAWRRIRNHTQGEPQDFGILQRLADYVLQEHPIYPWLPHLLSQLAITPDTLRRLVRSGWLRELEGGAFQVWHDRLLCWAVAQSIASRKHSGELTIEAVQNLLRSIDARQDGWKFQLAYVPLDVLWLLTDPSLPNNNKAESWRLLSILEPPNGYDFRNNILYQKLLPTLGERIIPTVIERVRHTEGDTQITYARLATDTCREIARHTSEPVQRQIRSCLSTNHPGLEYLGLCLAKLLPEAGYLDQIWEVFCSFKTNGDRQGVDGHNRHEILFSALAACLQTDPAWAVPKIASIQDSSLLSAIVYLLAYTQGTAAKQVWQDNKSRLFDRIAEPDRQCLINCIFRFRDGTELDRLSEWVHSEQELVGPCALSTLACFDPDHAAGLLGQISVQSLTFFASKLPPILMAMAPSTTCQQIRMLCQKQPEHALRYLRIMSGDCIDTDTIDAAIDIIDQIVANYLQNSGEDNRNGLYDPLDYLANLRGAVVLERLKQRRGSPFEDHLAQVACRWANNTSGYVHREFEAAKSILLKISGDGFTRVTNALLGSTGKDSQHEGCKAALIQPDPQTRRLLVKLAHQNQLWGSGNNAFPVVQQYAINTLAAIGENAELVRAVLRWGTKVSVYLPQLRSNRPPLTDTELQPAIALLESSDLQQQANAILTIGISGRTDIRPRIREFFLRSPVDSQVALAAMQALRYLDGYDPELDARLIAQYRSGHHKFAAASLITMGELHQVAPVLIQMIPSAGPYDYMDQRIITQLAAYEGMRHLVESQLRELQNNRSNLDFTFFTEQPRLRDPNQAQDAEWLWNTASQPEGSFHIGGVKAKAILQLAKKHPAAAFDLACQSLRNDNHDREVMPVILLKLDAERALPILIDHALEAYDRKMCRTIALQLRCTLPIEHLAESIGNCLRSTDCHHRQAGAEMAGYLGSSFLSDMLRQLVLTDNTEEVCFTAVNALRCQQKEAEAIRLMAALQTAEGIDTWAVAEEIGHVADPQLLLMNTKPLKFLDVLRQKPFSLYHHMNERLHNREEKVVKDLEPLSGKWDKDF